MAADRSPDRPLWRGLAVLTVGMGVFLAWSALTGISGAVVASGQVTVEPRMQAIQHPDGGRVAELHVRDGSAVRAGDPILTLDGTELRARRAVTARALAETLARVSRLEAEIRGADGITPAAGLADFAADDAEAAEIMDGEAALFRARRESLGQTLALLDERKVRTRSGISGRERQLQAGHRHLEVVLEDIGVQESLFGSGFAAKNRLQALRRERADLEGRIGGLEAEISEARSAIAGFELEKLRQETEFRRAARAELRGLQPRGAELREELRLTETRLDRLVLRAPMAGTVLDLKAHTVGGVVIPGAEIALIVPSDVPTVISVWIDPARMDQVHTGQKATVRFPNFSSSITPEIEGWVTTVSAGAMADPETGQHRFVAELALADGALDALGDVTLQPGMPVEAFIQTDTRSPLSYLLKPLRDYWTHAMREE